MGKLKRWNLERLKGSLKAAVARKERDIHELSCCRGSLAEFRVREAKKELDLLLEEEEKYWKSRSREDWRSSGAIRIQNGFIPRPVSEGRAIRLMGSLMKRESEL